MALLPFPDVTGNITFLHHFEKLKDKLENKEETPSKQFSFVQKFCNSFFEIINVSLATNAGMETCYSLKKSGLTASSPSFEVWKNCNKKLIMNCSPFRNTLHILLWLVLGTFRT